MEIDNRSIESYEEAVALAEKQTTEMGKLYIGTDRGNHIYPRYEVIEAPAVGDFVSYGFNGDYYPDSKIVKISPTMKKITTENGTRYYRRRLSGTWVRGKTWVMCKGHHDKRNPSF